MGKGAAQLGKAVKGKSKERKSAKHQLKEAADDAQLKEDMKMLEECAPHCLLRSCPFPLCPRYEKLAKLSEAQKARLKKLQLQEAEITRINKLKLRNIHRAFMRNEKTVELRKEMELLIQSHERNMERNDTIIDMLTRDLDDSEEQ